MSVLQNNHIKIPYFNKCENLTVGLNLLGLRNCSESLFTQLLPGLNNVTLRIRYYSFYCWIIREYYNKCKNKKVSPSKDEFNKFIRRAEYLLAIIEASREERGGLPGISYASDNYDSSENIINIAKAADKGTDNKTYWSNIGGALNQYYIASLFDLGLIGTADIDSSMVNISTIEGYINGEMLADAFGHSVTKQYGSIFLHHIDKGSIDKKTIQDLSRPFDMHNLSDFEDERKLLIDTLTQKDYPHLEESTYNRKNTILYFLEYCKINTEHKKSDLGFAKYMHDKCEKTNPQTRTLLGWYAYFLNDNWQYYYTSIFSSLLELLKTNIRISISQVADIMTKEIVAPYKSDNILEVINNELSSIKQDSLTGELCKAFYNLIKLVADNECAMSESMQYFSIHSYNYFDFANKILNSNETLTDFVNKFIQEDIIYRHYALSFQKQQYTGIATQKFIIENDIMVYYASYPASHTSPRISSLMNFLQDLSLIEENVLTKDGIKLTNNLSYD